MTSDKNLAISNVYWNLLVMYKGTGVFKERYFSDSVSATLITKDGENVFCVVYKDKPNDYFKFGGVYITQKFSQFFRDNVVRMTFSPYSV